MDIVLLIKPLALFLIIVYICSVMATPIKITPVIKGNDSRSFNKALKENQSQKVSAEEKSAIFSLVEKVLSNKRLK